MIVQLIVGLVLVGHGLIHVMYLTPGPDDPTYPFTLDESWLLPASMRRVVGSMLAIFTIVAFTALGLAAWRVPGLEPFWRPLVVSGSMASLALLIAFWYPRIVVGFAIDVALVILTVAMPDWWEQVIP